MKTLHMRLAFLLLVSFLFGEIKALQSELSVVIEPNSRECFHQYLEKDLNVYIDFQVIAGGELDISFWLNSPSNRVIINEFKKNIGQNHFKTDEVGEYRLCFDNSFSRFAQKQVFFYLYSPDPFVDPHFPVKNMNEIQPEMDRTLQELDIEVETFNKSFSRVWENLEKAQRVQAVFRVYENIDRNIMENNYEKVNMWSTINIVVMVVVGIVQVVLIRSLFEDKSKIGRVLRKGKVSSD